MAVVVLEVPMVVTLVLEEQGVVETLTNQELPIVVVAEAEESLGHESPGGSGGSGIVIIRYKYQ